MSLRKIVVVSREAKIQQLAQQVSHEVYVADDLAETLDIVKTVDPDLILFDHRFGPTQIREFLNTADENLVDIPVAIVGNACPEQSRADESDAFLLRSPSVEFIQMAASDYLQPSQVCDRLKQIASQMKKSKTAGSEKGFPQRPDLNNEHFFVDDFAASVGMVGRSRAFIKTLGMIRLVAASQCNPVLIIGETGTGKELAARAIHALRHPGERFVAVNCAALTANLLESELFGHVKGSFTGADREKTGLLELAGTGSILLDEISEMPLELQVKLLRVLQEKTFRKVGGVKDIPCHATIMASSNRNLYKEMKANRFRRDLYYRLNICPVIISALRSPGRRKDIPLLAEYFVKTSAICPQKHPRITGLTNLALEALQKHDWPGNVRELRNVIDRAILLETTDKVGLSSIVIDDFAQTHFFAFGGHDSAETTTSPMAEEAPSESQTVPPRCREAGLAIKDFSLAKAERELIARALAETGWQKTQAAALLGITRATLYAKVKQYNIKKPPIVTTASPSTASSEPDSSLSEKRPVCIES